MIIIYYHNLKKFKKSFKKHNFGHFILTNMLLLRKISLSLYIYTPIIFYVFINFH